ncbi:hypothetical protein D5018_11255 [Parashewanella curva]|uniref:Uncharacterized protein n=1 Tax=Parashewanella curva TaxID=2338552 RepID=A0A3L8PXT7_9GAMM|nr:hypothetical protein [Parashewanella curva]RLV59619.1 hypothetical protein D5018_11255 [Parashewanella curva]
MKLHKIIYEQDAVSSQFPIFSVSPYSESLPAISYPMEGFPSPSDEIAANYHQTTMLGMCEYQYFPDLSEHTLSPRVASPLSQWFDRSTFENGYKPALLKVPEGVSRLASLYLQDEYLPATTSLKELRRIVFEIMKVFSDYKGEEQGKVRQYYTDLKQIIFEICPELKIKPSLNICRSFFKICIESECFDGIIQLESMATNWGLNRLRGFYEAFLACLICAPYEIGDGWLNEHYAMVDDNNLTPKFAYMANKISSWMDDIIAGKLNNRLVQIERFKGYSAFYGFLTHKMLLNGDVLKILPLIKDRDLSAQATCKILNTLADRIVLNQGILFELQTNQDKQDQFQDLIHNLITRCGTEYISAYNAVQKLIQNQALMLTNRGFCVIILYLAKYSTTLEDILTKASNRWGFSITIECCNEYLHRLAISECKSEQIRRILEVLAYKKLSPSLTTSRLYLRACSLSGAGLAVNALTDHLINNAIKIPCWHFINAFFVTCIELRAIASAQYFLFEYVDKICGMELSVDNVNYYLILGVVLGQTDTVKSDLVKHFKRQIVDATHKEIEASVYALRGTELYDPCSLFDWYLTPATRQSLIGLGIQQTKRAIPYLRMTLFNESNST